MDHHHHRHNHHNHMRFHKRVGGVLRRAASFEEVPHHHMHAARTVSEEKASVVVLQPRASKSCTDPHDPNTCEKDDGPSSVPIILGVIIPVVLCIFVCIFLHRKFIARQRREDNDRHKSLDFGTEVSRRTGGKGAKPSRKPVPEMVVTDFEKSGRHGRGMSMDLDMSSPYILPAALKGSRESLHSLSRSMKDEYDPYRPVTMASDLPRYPGVRGDNASSYTASSAGTYSTDAVNASLVKNAKRMSQSLPLRGDSKSLRNESQSPPLSQQTTMNGSSFSKEVLTPPPPVASPVASPRHQQFPRDLKQAPTPPPASPYSATFSDPSQPLLSNNAYVPPSRSPSDARHAHSSPQQPPDLSRANSSHQPVLPQIAVQEFDSFDPSEAYGEPEFNQHAPIPKRGQSLHGSQHRPQYQDQHQDQHHEQHQQYQDEQQYYDQDQDQHHYEDHHQYNGEYQYQDHQHYQDEHSYHDDAQQPSYGLGVDQPEYGRNRLSMSVRPLPPDDPSEDAETRANRIRSFYREYFDDSKPNPVGKVPHFPGEEDYYEDYDQEFLGDGAIFDPETGQFVVASRPYAEPVTRRAMTPPPRAPPRFRGGPSSHRSNGSVHSTGTYALPPRGMSAMSGRMYPPQQRKKALPPPKALKSLPTPSLLKNDNILVFDSMDFAPPPSFRDRQAGRRPDSPMGVSRPYSPSVRAFTPLQSSYDDLSVMPSPHLLRKSGTFTALDFAPPTRLRDIDTGSDVASIRSGRSGLSQAQVFNMRAGAYRVSRIPRELAGTRAEITESLKPSWDLKR